MHLNTFILLNFIHSALIYLIWKDKDLYTNILSILGGFHQLKVTEKKLYKRQQCIGYKDSFVDS